MLPPLTLYVGLAGDLLIEGPGVAHPETPFDFTDPWVDVKVSCAALGITKLASVSSQAQVQNGGADVLVHFLPSDTTGKVSGNYPYQVEVKDANGYWHDAGGIGNLALKDPA